MSVCTTVSVLRFYGCCHLYFCENKYLTKRGCSILLRDLIIDTERHIQLATLSSLLEATPLEASCGRRRGGGAYTLHFHVKKKK